jgi:hypothetical protein
LGGARQDFIHDHRRWNCLCLGGGQLTINERIAQAHQRSVALYLQRQRVEVQRQQLGHQAQQIDSELIALDGEIRVLNELAAEATRGE